MVKISTLKGDLVAKLGSLCLFCGSRLGAHPAYGQAAETLAGALVKRNIRLIYGGGKVGMMGTVARAVMEGGGEVIGVIPDFLQTTEGLEDITRTIVTRSMHERKQVMFDLSQGFLSLPGGIGTLDETIEMMTWSQLQRHQKPIALLNVENYWDPLIALFDHTVQQGFGDARTHEDLIHAETVEGALDELEGRV